jgi:hypothetical protein
MGSMPLAGLGYDQAMTGEQFRIKLTSHLTQ